MNLRQFSKTLTESVLLWKVKTDVQPVSYTGCPGWGSGGFWGGVMYYIGEINNGVPPGLGGGYLRFGGGLRGLYKSPRSTICEISEYSQSFGEPFEPKHFE